MLSLLRLVGDRVLVVLEAVAVAGQDDDTADEIVLSSCKSAERSESHQKGGKRASHGEL